ncbi:hypothetical protein LSUE1_G005386 [Lachnellula suecica]|uniref:non-specific serine/threonine protein kinase n=1 Tax=Lachnellula suecica TaxID=602035 RepID=A0A8T9C1E4_9HELO|nr:hypothetical protein LSUE1_G005386 [Lachnellula suecica]
MSFGFSVGDFIAVGQLTWTVYKGCKGAPGEFQELSRELSTLHTVLHELEDEAKTPTSLLNRRGSSRKAEIDSLVTNLSDVLKQIEDIVKRYHSLGRDQKRTWDRVKFATEDLTTLRAKLAFHMNGLNVFIASLSASSLARIEGVLDELIKDIKAGRKEPSVISAHDESDEAAWHELERELIGDGITKQDIETHKEDIKQYLIKLVQDNTFDDGSCSEEASLAGNIGELVIDNEDGITQPNSTEQQSMPSSHRPSLDDEDGIAQPNPNEPQSVSSSQRSSFDYERPINTARHVDRPSLESYRQFAIDWTEAGPQTQPAPIVVLKHEESNPDAQLKARPTSASTEIRPPVQDYTKAASFRGLFLMSAVSRKAVYEVVKDIQIVLNSLCNTVDRVSSYTYTCSSWLMDNKVEFQVLIVKVSLLGLHGIQFKKISGARKDYSETRALFLERFEGLEENW